MTKPKITALGKMRRAVDRERVRDRELIQAALAYAEAIEECDPGLSLHKPGELFAVLKSAAKSCTSANHERTRCEKHVREGRR